MKSLPALPALRLALLPLCLAALTGCDTVRDTLGFERSGPNEFDVSSAAPLSMPPDYNLRPPEPGAARPQEVPANIQAQRTLLGTPLDGNVTTKNGAGVNASGGEGALLAQAGSTGGSNTPTAVTSSELPKITPQQERVEKALFGKPAAVANPPAIEMESRGGMFDWF